MSIQVKTTISGGGRDLGPTGGQVTQITIRHQDLLISELLAFPQNVLLTAKNVEKCISSTKVFIII